MEKGHTFSFYSYLCIFQCAISNYLSFYLHEKVELQAEEIRQALPAMLTSTRGSEKVKVSANDVKKLKGVKGLWRN